MDGCLPVEAILQLIRLQAGGRGWGGEEWGGAGGGSAQEAARRSALRSRPEPTSSDTTHSLPSLYETLSVSC